MVGAAIAQFEVRGTIGRGAHGTVYLGYDPGLDRTVAIKELAPALAGDPAFVASFQAEAELMATLDHPNCVRIFDFLQIDGRSFLVEEYVAGASLRRVIQSSGQLAPQQALGVLKGALQGLARAHAIGVVHRDFKPENILVDLAGISKLADFGQAAVGSSPGADNPLGGSSGSPAYMSPEQASGAGIDQRSDLYSAGVVLFELLTSRLPFEAPSALAVMRLHTSTPAPDPRSYNPNLHASSAALLDRALAKDPGARFQDCAEFLAALEAAAVESYGPDWERSAGIGGLVAAAALSAGALAPAPAPPSVVAGVGVVKRTRGFLGVAIGSALLGLGLALFGGLITRHSLLVNGRTIVAGALVVFGVTRIIASTRRAWHPHIKGTPRGVLGIAGKMVTVVVTMTTVVAVGFVALGYVGQGMILRQQQAAAAQQKLNQELSKPVQLCPDPAFPNFGVGAKCYAPCPPGSTFYNSAPPSCLRTTVPTQQAPVTHQCPPGYPYYHASDNKCYAQPAAAASFDGIYDYTFQFPSPTGAQTRTLPSYVRISGGVMSSSDGQLSGQVSANGAVVFTVPCPVSSGHASGSGTLNITSGSGGGNYQCNEHPMGITPFWRLSNRR